MNDLLEDSSNHSRFPMSGFLDWFNALVGDWRPRLDLLLKVVYWLLVGIGRLVWGLVVLVLLLVASVVCLVASVLPE